MNAKSGGLDELNPSMAAISYFGVGGAENIITRYRGHCCLP